MRQAPAAPPMNWNAVSVHKSATPSNNVAAVAACARPETRSAVIITRLRGRRSAITPPTSMKSTVGSILAASTIDIAEADR